MSELQPQPAPPPVSIESFISELLVTALASIAKYRAAVIDGDDPEDIHQLRVWVRKVRTYLKVFSSVLDHKSITALNEELKALTRRLNPVRDTDVLTDRLIAISTVSGPAVSQQVIDKLVAGLLEQTQESRKLIRRELRNRRYKAVAKFDTKVIGKALPADIRNSDLNQLLQKLNDRLDKAVVRGAEEAKGSSPDHQLHQLRIKAKHARYLADASLTQLGEPMRVRAKKMEKVQTLLGEHQDSTVMTAWLGHVPYPTREHILTIEALLRYEQSERIRLRKEWSKLRKAIV